MPVVLREDGGGVGLPAIQALIDDAVSRGEYDRLFQSDISSNFITWDNPNELTLVLLFADGDTEVTFGNFQTPQTLTCLLYTSPSPRDKRQSRMPSSA